MSEAHDIELPTMCGSRISRRCAFSIDLPMSDPASFPLWSVHSRACAVDLVQARKQSGSAHAPTQRKMVARSTRSTRASSPSANQSEFVAKEHLRLCGESTCLICGRSPSHAHHVPATRDPRLSLKVSDEFTVPLCAIHHHNIHTTGKGAREWWQERNIDPPARLPMRFGSKAVNGIPASENRCIERQRLADREVEPAHQAFHPY